MQALTLSLSDLAMACIPILGFEPSTLKFVLCAVLGLGATLSIAVLKSQTLYGQVTDVLYKSYELFNDCGEPARPQRV